MGCAIVVNSKTIYARRNGIFVEINIEPLAFAEIIDNVLYATGGGSAQVIDGVLVATGDMSAEIAQGVLYVKQEVE